MSTAARSLFHQCEHCDTLEAERNAARADARKWKIRAKSADDAGFLTLLVGMGIGAIGTLFVLGIINAIASARIVWGN